MVAAQSWFTVKAERSQGVEATVLLMPGASMARPLAAAGHAATHASKTVARKGSEPVSHRLGQGTHIDHLLLGAEVRSVPYLSRLQMAKVQLRSCLKRGLSNGPSVDLAGIPEPIRAE
jgi:hypothetical protein